MHFADLVASARATAVAPSADTTAHGFMRLPGGMSHDVYSPFDDENLVVKVFRSNAGAAAEREWDALIALGGLDIAPEAVFLDIGGPPVVVMTRAPGKPHSAVELDSEHGRMIGTVHRLVHQTIPAIRRLPRHTSIRETQTALTDDLASRSALREDQGSELVARAWRAAQTWMANFDIRYVLSGGELCFMRGDPNLNNYLWSDGRVVLIDWEASGYNDRVLELARMIEHPSAWALSDEFWAQLADATELTREAWRHLMPARRLAACFWLVSIEGRARQALPTTVTLDEQAARTLAVLEG